MKARVKSTGEIVEIKDLYDDGTALVGNMYIKVSELNFFSENIDWEQRRYELAKDIIKIVIANDYGVNSDVVAKYSLNCADALIKRLKENNYDRDTCAGDYPCIERHIEQRGNCIRDLNDPDSGAPRSASGGRTCAWCTGSKGNSALCAWQYHTGAIHSASDHTNLYLAERHEDF